ncbi:hypothetical protein PR202_gb17486 [Eleusine coracana subsp. coracana]|uniref:Uncharacterized protein n=1 Tax=Eleusine coracana subsp. coracana TaxID=191504 RepID=A0AAV5F398_ELECO|nr:hypothetical protein QOZ80_6BG0465710 [Eleusine coracana subsp. coracana]GJN29276.1 hypothetical protein PR202_gb17486 [Eleusine coracana subsp. coracana]
MAKEADPTRCRRHPRHRHAAGVCPFCLRDRLARLSAAAALAEANNADAHDAASSSMSSGSSSSSPCSYSWEQTVAPPALPPRRRERLGMLLLQEGREAAVLGSAAASAAAPDVEAEVGDEDKKAKRGNFWARLQQQLHHGGWHRKDGCSLAHSRVAVQKSAVVAAAGRPRREPMV